VSVALGISQEELAVRIAADRLYERYDLAMQYRIMEKLGRTNVKVPRLLAYEGDLTLLGRPFYVMYDTGGRSVPEWPSYHKVGWFYELDPDGQRSVWLEAVDTIGAIHRLDWLALGLEFVEGHVPGTNHYERWIRRHRNHLRWTEHRTGRSLQRLRAVFRWLEINFPVDTPISLIWADAKLGNLMLDGPSIVGVLDWEHCTIGPSLYDLANLMIFDRMLSQGAAIPRLAGLPDRSESIQYYEAGSDRSARGIEYFELFSAMRMATVQCGLAPELIVAGRVRPSYAEDNIGTRVLGAQIAAMGLDL
jgi:aminoglycoside phosphotransferase (APT) family kinase protein